MKKVQVLMSTYNGGQFLIEQIESILKQDSECHGVAKVCLLVRDDGSIDNTQNILREYTDLYPERISWYQGENKGAAGSFFDLLAAAADDADYYAFADQDDFWHADKVKRAVECLEAMPQDGRPRLYCCRTQLTDAQLNVLSSEITYPVMRPGFLNAIIENIAIGCTIIIDKTLRDMVREDYTEYTVMHDWWCYLVCSCFGNIYYDETPHIFYRQHGNNTLGSNVSLWKEFKDRVKRFKRNRNNISRQIEAFLNIYEDRAEFESDNTSGTESVGKLNYGTWSVPLAVVSRTYMENARELLNGKKSFFKRVRIVQRGVVYRQRKTDNIIFKVILLLGSF